MVRIVLPLVLLGALFAVPNQTQAQTCGFRNHVWWIVQDTSDNLVHADVYQATDQVIRTRADREAAYAKLVAEYGWPDGWWQLKVALRQVWDHIWSWVYWHTYSKIDSGLKNGLLASDLKHQRKNAKGGWQAMNAAWSAANRVC
jgi:hypothetical protein